MGLLIVPVGEDQYLISRGHKSPQDVFQPELSMSQFASKAEYEAALSSQPKPECMSITEAREYLVKFMEQHFTDKTFHRYIRGERGENSLAADFAWQMATAIKAVHLVPAPPTEIVYQYRLKGDVDWRSTNCIAFPTYAESAASFDARILFSSPIPYYLLSRILKALNDSICLGVEYLDFLKDKYKYDPKQVPQSIEETIYSFVACRDEIRNLKSK
jgi:hypothetical protein